jgi:phosphoglycerate dehydrogenase-like enzyme
LVTKPRVLFLTDRGERHQRLALRAAPEGLEVIMRRTPSEGELTELLPTVDFLISERSQAVTAAMLKNATKLKQIIRLGSLSYDIDIETARQMGIRVSLQPVIGSIYAAEHVLMMVLAVLKRLGRSLNAATAADHGVAARRTDENTFGFNWLSFSDIDGLYGKTVAILGMGEIGIELARRLKSFHINSVFYNKRTQYPQAVEREFWLRYAAPLECVKQADVLVSLLPFTAVTDRSIHGGTFELMKPSAVFVHAGSGSVIDEQALAEALKAKTIAGAALDTYEFEPLQPTHSLVALARDPKSNLLLTPHVAAASLPEDRSEDYAEIMRLIRQQPLKHEIH